MSVFYPQMEGFIESQMSHKNAKPDCMMGVPSYDYLHCFTTHIKLQITCKVARVLWGQMSTMRLSEWIAISMCKRPLKSAVKKNIQLCQWPHLPPIQPHHTQTQRCYTWHAHFNFICNSQKFWVAIAYLLCRQYVLFHELFNLLEDSVTFSWLEK